MSFNGRAGVPQKDLAPRYAFPARDTTLGPHDRVVIDTAIVRDADLSAKHSVVADPRASRDTRLRRDDRVAADPDVMSDLAEVVDLDTFVDQGVVQTRLGRCMSWPRPRRLSQFPGGRLGGP